MADVDSANLVAILPIIKTVAVFNDAVSALRPGGYYILSEGHNPATVWFKMYRETTQEDLAPLYRIKRDLMLDLFPPIQNLLNNGKDIVMLMTKDPGEFCTYASFQLLDGAVPLAGLIGAFSF